jgi:hypothetical protein
MKYKVGDVLFLKTYEYHRRIPRQRRGRRLKCTSIPTLNVMCTFGIIIIAEKHSDIFNNNSTKDDNYYIWVSQFDGKQYCFHEDEVDGEVI